jgi:hypothetical protein|tara:strand:- start:2016 stop:2336 length:321 start_codon:yes stop_codon:yes gene_type:complete
MDIGSLKKESDLSFDVAIAKRNALEKAHSRLVVVYNEHIFRADAETINLVKTLEEVHSSPFYILDTNNNPVEVSNSKELLHVLVERNQEAMSSYHQMSKTFEKRND